MSKHQDVVAEYYAAFNRRDGSVYTRFFTKDCTLAAPGVRLAGVEATHAFDDGWRAAFAEARIESLRLSESEGAVLASNWFHGGAQIAPLATGAGTIPPNGRAFSAPYSATFEFDGDRIRAQRIVFDAEYMPVLLGIVSAETMRTTPGALDVVQAIYAAFARGDVGGVIDRIDPAGVLTFEGPTSLPWAGTYRGRDGWGAFFRALGGHVDDLHVAMTPFAVDGEKVAMAGRYTGRVKTTGRLIDSPLVHLWTVRHGLVASCVEMTNTAGEIAAV